MAIVQAKPEEVKAPTPAPASAVGKPRVDEKLIGPGKYEITPEVMFTVNVHLKLLEGGRWILMAGSGKGVDSHKVVFRMWTYDEMIDLKKMATNFDPIKRMHMIDNDQLNRLKVQKLMVSWTFDRENPRLKLHHFQGVLTDESWEAVKKLQANILDYIIGEMNKVYELNG